MKNEPGTGKCKNVVSTFDVPIKGKKISGIEYDIFYHYTCQHYTDCPEIQQI